jgi:hypothetical protein
MVEMLKRQSSCVKVCSLVIVTVMLCPYMAGNTAAQETRKKSYDLSARKAGDVLKLKPEVWTEINRFVFLIAFDSYVPELPGLANHEKLRQFNKLDSYPKLHQACQRWGDVTFTRLQRLAKERSTGDIRRLLTDLKSAVDRRPKDPAGARRDFDVAADELVGKISYWETLSKEVKQDLDFLTTQTLAAAIQLQGTPSPQTPAWRRPIVDIRPVLTGVVAALAGVHDHWGALSSDLSVLRKEMGTNLNSRDPFELDITLEIGLTNWESVEAAAKTFMTNVPTQLSYLTGDSYYNECPLREDVWYLMQTQESLMRYRTEPGYQERTALGIKPLTTGSATLLLLYGQGSGTGEPDPKMQWRFKRLGRGWLRIINRAEGESKSLEISFPYFDFKPVRDLYPERSNDKLWTSDYFPTIKENKSSDNAYRMDGIWVDTSQRWRCVPMGKFAQFDFRIYNAQLGESQSLKMDSWSSNQTMFTRMDPSSNSLEQIWRFVPTPINELEEPYLRRGK